MFNFWGPMDEVSIHDACIRGDLELVQDSLAANPAEVDAEDEYGWRPIFHAALRGHEDVVRLLLAAGADLSARNGEAIHFAAEVPGNQAVVTLLLQYGALHAHVGPVSELSYQSLCALFLADAARLWSLLHRHPELATLPDGRGDQPILHAARNGHAEIIGILLDFGADANARNERGHTALYCAGAHGHVEALNLLLEYGADCDAPLSGDGETLLDWLAEYPDDTRFQPVVALLQQHKSQS